MRALNLRSWRALLDANICCCCCSSSSSLAIILGWFWEFANTSYSWGVWSPSDYTRSAREHVVATTFSGAFAHVRWRRSRSFVDSRRLTLFSLHQRKTDGRTDGRLESKRRTTSDERTDGRTNSIKTTNDERRTDGWLHLRSFDRLVVCSLTDWSSLVVVVDTQSVVGRRRRRTAALSAMSVIIHPSRCLNRSWDCTYITSNSASQFSPWNYLLLVLLHHSPEFII